MRRLALALVAAALASPVVALPADSRGARDGSGRLLPQRWADDVAIVPHDGRATPTLITPADPTTASHPEGRRDLHRIDRHRLVAADMIRRDGRWPCRTGSSPSVTPTRVSPPAP